MDVTLTPALKIVALAAALVTSASHVQAQEPSSCQVQIGDQRFEANLRKGRIAYLKCKACHTLEPGGRQMVGPNLGNIFSRAPLAAEGFKYSNAFQEAQLSWTNDNMDAFLTKPTAMVAKTKMIFAGYRDPQKRADVIAYLHVKTTAEGACPD